MQVLLRWAELIALRRHHVDLDAGFVVVRESVVEVSNVLTTVRPKSAAGVREVGIPAAIVPDLREHLRRRSEPGSNGRAFVGPKGATPRRTHVSQLWQAATV